MAPDELKPRRTIPPIIAVVKPKRPLSQLLDHRNHPGYRGNAANQAHQRYRPLETYSQSYNKRLKFHHHPSKASCHDVCAHPPSEDNERDGNSITQNHYDREESTERIDYFHRGQRDANYEGHRSDNSSWPNSSRPDGDKSNRCESSFTSKASSGRSPPTPRESYPTPLPSLPSISDLSSFISARETKKKRTIAGHLFELWIVTLPENIRFGMSSIDRNWEEAFQNKLALAIREHLEEGREIVYMRWGRFGDMIIRVRGWGEEAMNERRLGYDITRPYKTNEHSLNHAGEDNNTEISRSPEESLTFKESTLSNRLSHPSSDLSVDITMESTQSTISTSILTYPSTVPISQPEPSRQCSSSRISSPSEPTFSSYRDSHDPAPPEFQPLDHIISDISVKTAPSPMIKEEQEPSTTSFHPPKESLDILIPLQSFGDLTSSTRANMMDWLRKYALHTPQYHF
jgi:hypothetical protein